MSLSNLEVITPQVLYKATFVSPEKYNNLNLYVVPLKSLVLIWTRDFFFFPARIRMWADWLPTSDFLLVIWLTDYYFSPHSERGCVSLCMCVLARCEHSGQECELIQLPLKSQSASDAAEPPHPPIHVDKERSWEKKAHAGLLQKGLLPADLCFSKAFCC